MKAKLRKTRNKNKFIMLFVLCIFFIVCGVFYYQNKANTIVSVIPSSTNDQEQTTSNKDETPTSNEVPQPVKNQKQQNAPTQASVNIIAPYGSFVSNHRPNLGTLSKMQSVCSTTPGAKCSITFKKNGQTKSLAEQTVGSDGSTTWDWDIVDAGLSVGTWEITATASSGGKTLSTKDTINLEVTE